MANRARGILPPRTTQRRPQLVEIQRRIQGDMHFHRYRINVPSTIQVSAIQLRDGIIEAFERITNEFPTVRARNFRVIIPALRHVTQAPGMSTRLHPHPRNPHVLTFETYRSISGRSIVRANTLTIDPVVLMDILTTLSVRYEDGAMVRVDVREVIELEYDDWFEVAFLVPHRRQRAHGGSKRRIIFKCCVVTPEDPSDPCIYNCLAAIASDMAEKKSDHHARMLELLMEVREETDIGMIADLLAIYMLPVDILLNRVEPLGFADDAMPIRIRLSPQKREIVVVPVTRDTCGLIPYAGTEYMEGNYHLVYDECARHIELLEHPTQFREEVYVSHVDRVYIKEGEGYIEVNNPKSKTRILPSQNEKRRRGFRHSYENPYFVVFDIEAVADRSIDGTNRQLPFKIGAFLLDQDGIPSLEEVEQTGAGLGLLTGAVKRFTGYRCLSDFLTWLGTLHRDGPERKIVCIGYNSARYDNILILGEFLRSNIPDSIPLDGIELQGPHLSGLNLFDGKAEFFDVCRFLAGGLDVVCKDFGAKILKKQAGSVDFEKINEIYEEAGMDNFFISLQQLEPAIDHYLNYDCLSLALIFERLLRIWNEIPCVAALAPNDDTDSDHTKMQKPLWSYSSLPAAMYAMMQASWSRRGISLKNGNGLPHIPLVQRHYIQRDTVGGGCSVFDHAKNEVVHGRVSSLDACSMYPATMCIYNRCWLPCGHITIGTMTDELREEILGAIASYLDDETKKPLYMGYFWISLDQSNLARPDLPLHHPEQKSLLEPAKKPLGGNDWSTRGPAVIQERKYLNFFRVAELVKYGCSIDLIDGEYLRFSNAIRGIDLFKELLDFMDKKMLHDTYKKNKDPRLNMSVRTMTKTASNAISGKFAEGLHPDRTARMTMAEFEEMEKNPFLADYESLSVIAGAGLNVDGEELFWVSFRVPLDSLDNQAKPIYISDHIWTFSRQYIYRVLIHPLGHAKARYWDTDSVKFASSDFPLVSPFLQNLIPVWEDIVIRYPEYATRKLYDPNSKNTGSFEDELAEMFMETFSEKGIDPENALTYIIEPKVYAIVIINPVTKEAEEAFVKLKGIRKDSIYINDMDQVGKFATVKGNKLIIMLDKQTAVAAFIRALQADVTEGGNGQRSRWMTQPKVAHQVFRNLSEGESCFFLQTQFVRVIRNHLKNVRPGDVERYQGDFGTVKTPFIIKSIQ
jgi:hypothetical protein